MEVISYCVENYSFSAWMKVAVVSYLSTLLNYEVLQISHKCRERFLRNSSNFLLWSVWWCVKERSRSFNEDGKRWNLKKKKTRRKKLFPFMNDSWTVWERWGGRAERNCEPASKVKRISYISNIEVVSLYFCPHVFFIHSMTEAKYKCLVTICLCAHCWWAWWKIFNQICRLFQFYLIRFCDICISQLFQFNKRLLRTAVLWLFYEEIPSNIYKYWQ